MNLNQKAITAALRRQLKRDRRAQQEDLARTNAALDNLNSAFYIVEVGPGVMVRGHNLEATIRRAVKKYAAANRSLFHVHFAVCAEFPGVTDFNLPRTLWEDYTKKVVEEFASN